jgi:hypothetical protein
MMPFMKDGTFYVEAGCVASEGGAVHLGGGACRCAARTEALRIRARGGVPVIIRDRINSVAGSMDEAHGRPFVLGKSERVPRFVMHYASPRSVERVPVQVGSYRVWLACVLMPDGTWRDDYAFSGSEVFTPCL